MCEISLNVGPCAKHQTAAPHLTSSSKRNYYCYYHCHYYHYYLSCSYYVPGITVNT